MDMNKDDQRDRAARTNIAAKTITDAESKARDAKTDRLRKLRMAQEAVDAPPAASKPAKTPGARRPAK
jgi:hypothetical protein